MYHSVHQKIFTSGILLVLVNTGIIYYIQTSCVVALKLYFWKINERRQRKPIPRRPRSLPRTQKKLMTEPKEPIIHHRPLSCIIIIHHHHPSSISHHLASSSIIIIYHHHPSSFTFIIIPCHPSSSTIMIHDHDP